MNIHQRIGVGLAIFVLIITSTVAQAKNKNKNKIRTCADLKTKVILKKARPYKSTIEKYARLNRVNADFVLAIAAVETCFNSRAVSPVGARGLMQLMPATAKRFGVVRVSNARQNVKGGTKYLRFLMKRYKSNMRYAAAAYNAGEGRVDRYKGVPPYRETRRYVRNVLRVYKKLTQYRNKTARKKTKRYKKKIKSKSKSKSKKKRKKIAKRLKKETSLVKKVVYQSVNVVPKKRKTMSEKKNFQLAVSLLLKKRD